MAESPTGHAPVTRSSPSSDSALQTSSTSVSRGAAGLVASTSDIDRVREVIGARRTGNVMTLLPICAIPPASKSDSQTSAKSWPGANVNTLRNVARDKDTGQRHQRPNNATWVEMNKKYEERKEEDRNTRMRQKAFTFMFSVLVVLPVVVGIVGLLLIRALPVRAERYGEPSAGAFTDLSQLCTGLATNDSCLVAIRELQRAVDLDADPCRDFHQFACGRWRPLLGGGSSYISQTTKLFNALVHDKLLNVSFDIREGKPAPYGLSVHQMALFHASCYEMFTGRNSGGNINEVIEALGIEQMTWIAVASAERLVELAVSTSLRTGLSAFVNVRLLKGELHLEVGSSLVKAFVYKPGVRQYLVDAVIDLGVNISDPVEKTLDLDYKVDGLVLSYSESHAFRTFTVQELVDILPQINWNNAFNTDRPTALERVTNGTNISLRGVTFVKDVLQIFYGEQLPVIGLYGLLSALSTVMKFTYYARHVSFDEPFVGVKWCLLLTAWHFTKLFPAWVGTNFLQSNSTERFTKAFNEAMAVVLRDNVVNFGVYLETTLLSRTWLNIIGEPCNVLTTPTEPFPVTMNETFLPNLAAVIAAQVGSADREALFVESHALVMGQLGYGQRRHEKFAIPPALVASRGFLSLQVPEANVGMFALRYLVLRAIYERAAAYQGSAAPVASRTAIGGSSMAAYVQSCFGQSFRKSLNKSLGEDEIKSLMGGRWAVATAMAMADKDPVTSWRLDTRARRRLLYLVICATGCGDPRDADHCKDMSRTMPDFIHAYGCTEGADYKCNCSAVNNCETHLPSVTDEGYS